MNELGLNIKKRREQLGFTLRQVAQSTALSASLLSQVETGKSVALNALAEENS